MGNTQNKNPAAPDRSHNNRPSEPVPYKPFGYLSLFKKKSKPDFEPFNRPAAPTITKLSYDSPSLTTRNFIESKNTVCDTSSIFTRQTFPPKPISYMNSYHVPRDPVGVLPLNAKACPPIGTSYKEIHVPSSYEIWQRTYSNHRLSSNEWKAFDNRISDNSEQKRREMLSHEARLNRIKETAEMARGTTTTRPSATIESILDIKERLAANRIHDEKHFPQEAKLPELTTKMKEEIRSASIVHPPNEVLIHIDGAPISRRDIQTLLGSNWLNDEIINAYMHLIVLRGNEKSNYRKVYSFNTFFYPKVRDSGYASVKRWTRKVDIFSYDLLLVPVHLGNHWCLATIDINERTISYYDSLGGHSNGCCKVLLNYLKQESQDKKKQNLDDENWRSIEKFSEGIPRQMNCSDCGVFACTYAEYASRRAKLNFNQKHMPYFRQKMIYEIIKMKLIE